MTSRLFPWWWLVGSLILLFGTPAIYLGIVLRFAEPDGLADVGGFCIGILLMPLGFLSLVTVLVWLSRQRMLDNDEKISLNLNQDSE